MNIDATVTKIGSTATGSLARVGQSVGGSELVGGLMRRDVDLLRTVSGMNFNWPPKEGDGYPLAAAELSAVRADQVNKGIRVQELKSSDITALGKSGKLNAAFVAKAVAYLSSQGEDTTPTQGHTAASGTAVSRTAASGSVAGDGSRFL